MATRGKKAVMNVVIESRQLQLLKTNWAVHWTCPHCLLRQVQAWFGREVHFCNNCGEGTDIKGSEFPQAAVALSS